MGCSPETSHSQLYFLLLRLDYVSWLLSTRQGILIWTPSLAPRRDHVDPRFQPPGPACCKQLSHSGHIIDHVDAIRPWSARSLHLTGQELRLKGKNLTESEHVAPGAYHTLQIETQRAFTLEKALWDAVDLDRIQVACNPAARADLAAILMTVSSCLHRIYFRRLLAFSGPTLLAGRGRWQRSAMRTIPTTMGTNTDVLTNLGCTRGPRQSLAAAYVTEPFKRTW